MGTTGERSPARYALAREVREIFQDLWPSSVSPASINVATGPGFETAMRYIQAELIRLYLPRMARERVPYALQTLAWLERSL
jgi:hypothetical protein